MSKIFIIKDKSDANFRKPFVSIHKSEVGSQRKVAQLTSKLPQHAKHLVSVEPIEVKDFDPNKSSIYVIFDKTDNHFKQPVVGMFSEYHNASAELDKRKKTAPRHVQKLVFAQTYPVEP